MLEIEIKEKVLFHFKIPKSNLNVNSFVNFCDKAGETVSRKLFVNIMSQAQNAILIEYLGDCCGKPSDKLTFVKWC